MKAIRLTAVIVLSAFLLSGCATTETQVSNSCKYVVDANVTEMTRAEACGYEQYNKTTFQSGTNTGWDTLIFLTSLGM
jgi:hypothetical protein